MRRRVMLLLLLLLLKYYFPQTTIEDKTGKCSKATLVSHISEAYK